MKIIEVRTNLSSYTHPLIKIITSLLIILFSVFRNTFFTISVVALNFLVTLFCFVATLAAILCIYISVGELFYVRKSRKASKK